MVDRIPAPFIMYDAVLKLGATDDYAASVSKAQLTPTSTQSVWKGLTPSARIPVFGGTDWVLELTGAQDWDTEESLSVLMLEHAGETMAYTLEPVAGGASFTGTVLCAPGVVGGAQGTDAATSDYSLVSSVPTRTPGA